MSREDLEAETQALRTRLEAVVMRHQEQMVELNSVHNDEVCVVCVGCVGCVGWVSLISASLALAPGGVPGGGCVRVRFPLLIRSPPASVPRSLRRGTK